jgi:alpha-beta hydrolase superfamily lysophospholipase
MSFFQSQDGTQLHERVWPVDGRALAVVLIVHGYGEHIGRYDQTARDLNQSGFQVRGFDLRGHGQSGGARGHCLRFGEYLEDLEAAVVRARAEGMPLYLLGHSFGALISSHYAMDHANQLAGLVLTSPFFALALPVPAPKVWAGKLFSKLLPTLALPTGLKGTDVSRDPDVQRLYDSDPLNNKKATARWFTESQEAQVTLLQRASRMTLPLLMVAGGADPVAAAPHARVVFDHFGATDKTLRMLDGQLHEVLNELPEDRQKTIREIAEWLRAHAQNAPAGADGKLRAG